MEKAVKPCRTEQVVRRCGGTCIMEGRVLFSEPLDFLGPGLWKLEAGNWLRWGEMLNPARNSSGDGKGSVCL